MERLRRRRKRKRKISYAKLKRQHTSSLIKKLKNKKMSSIKCKWCSGPATVRDFREIDNVTAKRVFAGEYQNDNRYSKVV